MKGRCRWGLQRNGRDCQRQVTLPQQECWIIKRRVLVGVYTPLRRRCSAHALLPMVLISTCRKLFSNTLGRDDLRYHHPRCGAMLPALDLTLKLERVLDWVSIRLVLLSKVHLFFLTVHLVGTCQMCCISREVNLQNKRTTCASCKTVRARPCMKSVVCTSHGGETPARSGPPFSQPLGRLKRQSSSRRHRWRFTIAPRF